MRRDNLAFGLGGLLYGVLFGFLIFYVVEHRPQPEASPNTTGAPAPSGPMAPTQVGQGAGSGAAPMMQEIAALKQRVADAPDDGVALTRLANLYHDAGMWQEAVRHYQKALDVIPGDANLMTDMGVCYQGLEDFERALALFEEAQQADPTHWQSLYNTVIVAGFNLGRFERAEAALAKLEEVRPTAPGLDQLRTTLEQARSRQGGGDPS